MTFDQIMTLLDKGLSPDQILAAMKQPDPEPKTQPEPESQPEPAPQPSGNAEILAAIDKLTKSVQAAALFGARQPDPAPEPSSSDIILSEIMSRQGQKKGE